MSAETLQLPYGDQTIEFRLTRRDRKTMSISVEPNSDVEIVAPLDAPLDRILEKVRKRAVWIRKQQSFFAQFQPRTPDRQYLSGETHRYLGRQYKLKIVPDIQERVVLYRGQIIVRTHKPNSTETTEQLLQEWYKERARIKFAERIEACAQLFPDPKEFSPRRVTLRALKNRWGSMSKDGGLLLNRALIMASIDCIDYVIIHELCHIRYPHHGSSFYVFLGRVMPDWEKRKTKLERLLA